ncbi:MAG: shikimate kinase [Clostridiales bacterium]|nr:shikimate kinase [Clostridiales bacterium]
MKFVIIFGDGAVGKMTVGQELTKITDLKLFHNHQSIEPVIEIFGTYNKEVVKDFRESVFRNFAKSDNYGLIFTFMWAFDCQEDWDYIASITKIFEGADIYYIELVASQEVRLQRNVTENRLANKASKRDLEVSNKRIIDADEKYRLVSYDGEIPFNNYIKIDNTNLSPETVAKMIKEKFGL